MSPKAVVSGTGRSKLSRLRSWAAALASAAVLLTVAGAVASTMIKSPMQVAAEAGPPPPDVLTVKVERRVLQDTVVLRGIVVAGQTVDVSPAVRAGDGAAPVVTKLPVRPQDAVAEGQVLLEVSGRPIFVLKGSLPVYRDLKPGAEGDDVAQLQQALRRLGHGTGEDAPGRFGPGTKAALSSFYAAAGYDPLPAQADGGAAVAAAQDAETGAQRALEDAREALAAARAPVPVDTAAPGGSSPEAAVPTADLEKAVRRAEEDLAKARQTLTEARAADGPMLPAGEVVFVKDFPARVGKVGVHVGSQVSGPVMTLSSGALVVQGYVQDYQKALVRPGQNVRILSEITGATVAATVQSVATSIYVGDGKSEETGGQAEAPAGSGYLVVVRPVKALPAALAGQDVRLTIEAASTGGRVLVVPVTAVSAGADGRTVVTVLDGTGDQRRVEVRPGTTGDGFVEVTPVGSGRLAEGDEVVTGIDRGGPR